jgi:hypothetical protein
VISAASWLAPSFGVRVGGPGRLVDFLVVQGFRMRGTSTPEFAVHMGQNAEKRLGRAGVAEPQCVVPEDRRVAVVPFGLGGVRGRRGHGIERLFPTSKKLMTIFPPVGLTRFSASMNCQLYEDSGS